MFFCLCAIKNKGLPPSPLDYQVCGIGGPYGVGGNVSANKTVDEAYYVGGLLPFQNTSLYLKDFETGTVQQISELWKPLRLFCNISSAVNSLSRFLPVPPLKYTESHTSILTTNM